MYLPKRLVITLALVLAAFTLAFLYMAYSLCLGELFSFYSKNIRPSAFTAFLTVSIFLLSLKTFIVTTMKTNVYDDDRYLKKFLQKNSSKPEVILNRMYHVPFTDKFQTIKASTRKYQKRDLYLPLKNLSDALFIAIVISFSASVAQFSVGFLKSHVALFISLFLPLMSITMLVHCLIKISDNISEFLSKDETPLEDSSKK